MLSDRGDCLLAHIARQNPQHKDLQGQEVLVTLQGAHTYVSPTWYEKAGVPTWNFQAVHIYGQCTLVEDVERLAQMVSALSDVYESASSQPWTKQYPESMLNGIIGLEIEITEIQCK